MKRLLTLARALIALAVFSGPVVAQQSWSVAIEQQAMLTNCGSTTNIPVAGASDCTSAKVAAWNLLTTLFQIPNCMSPGCPAGSTITQGVSTCTEETYTHPNGSTSKRWQVSWTWNCIPSASISCHDDIQNGTLTNTAPTASNITANSATLTGIVSVAPPIPTGCTYTVELRWGLQGQGFSNIAASGSIPLSPLTLTGTASGLIAGSNYQARLEVLKRCPGSNASECFGPATIFTPINAAYAKICVLKFEDKNRNGRQDPGELALPGFTFEIKDASGNLIATITTGAAGKPCVDVPAPGTYTITELPRSPWISTTQNPRTVTVTPGQQVNLSFGNWKHDERTATICILKFEDKNGNGRQDRGELALAGFIFDIKDASGNVIATVTSGENGTVCTTVPAPGTYTIAEQVPSGWTSTTQNPQTVTVTPGQVVNLSFGNWKRRTATICVLKFEDKNGNGRQDPGELELPGFVFQIKNASGIVIGTIISGAAGKPCIDVPPGTYTITEQVPPGWTSTTPNPQTVTVTPGQVVNLSFGNWKRSTATICVLKFEDKNGNGHQDPGELELPGFIFHIKDASGNPVGTITSGDLKKNCIDVPAPGTYTITEQVPPGWTSTTQNPQTVTVTPGQVVNLSFGNWKRRPASICILKFEDKNENGHQDPGELALAGFIFNVKDASGNVIGTITSGGPSAAGGSAKACIDVPAPGTYTITEQVPPGWTATSQNPQTVTVTPGQVVNLSFGNWRKEIGTAKICVLKFDDKNRNGRQDPGELPLAGFMFQIKDASGTVVATITSIGQGGPACAAVPAPGTYTVTEVVPPGWTATSQNPQTVTVTPNHEFDLSFGNWKKEEGTAKICVLKFDDKNRNGRQDPGELPMPGFMFQIKDASGNVVATITSIGQGGPACAAVPAPGTYTVTEVVPPGWTATSQNPQTVTVTPNHEFDLSFGNWKQEGGKAEICVLKYEDKNRNGRQDPGELPLAGFMFQVKDASGNVIATITSGREGPACVGVPAPGTYTVTEQVPPGWTATTQNPQTVAVSSGQHVNLSFGNWKKAGAI